MWYIFLVMIVVLVALLLRYLIDTWDYPYSKKCKVRNCYFEVRGASEFQVENTLYNHLQAHQGG